MIDLLLPCAAASSNCLLAVGIGFLKTVFLLSLRRWLSRRPLSRACAFVGLRACSWCHEVVLLSSRRQLIVVFRALWMDEIDSLPVALAVLGSLPLAHHPEVLL